MPTRREEDDYRGYDDSDAPDDEQPPDPATLDLPRVSGMLRRLRGLYRELAGYEQLHADELARLADTHERYAGPLAARIRSLEAVLRAYAVRSFVDFGKTKVTTPNGVITASRPLIPVLDVIDEDLAQWTQVASIVETKPKIPVAKLRALLTQLEAADRVRRALLRKDELTILDQGGELLRPLDADEEGVYLERMAAEDDPWLLIEGLRWSPAGYDGSGRTFTVAPA